MKKNRLRRTLACLLCAGCAAGLLAGCGETSDVPEFLPPVLTEGMNRNRTVLMDGTGAYSDWVEIHNPNEIPLPLAGYTLSDSEKSPRKWEFPEDAVLKPGEYRVIFCSGEPESPGGDFHASFRISSGGEPVLLSDPAGSIVSRLDIPKLADDWSCGYAPDTRENLVYFQIPTPGAANTSKIHTEITEEKPPVYTLRINEYTTSNSYAFYDSDGDCPTWAEIHNFGTEPVEIGGMYLSDDALNVNKWQFPRQLVLEPDGYLLVLLSGKDKLTENELHASFRLGGSDTELVISDQNENVIDSVELQHADSNVSVGRLPGDAETWRYFAHPTPGEANSTTAFESLSASRMLPNRGIWISETMAVSGNPKHCQYGWDWVELYNGSEEPVDLTGWSMTDSLQELRQYVFPETVLQPGEYLMLYANGKEPDEDQPYQMPFGLSSAGETLHLFRPDGTLCDRFDTGRQKNGVSSGRGSGSEDVRLFFTEPTPGSSNAEGLTGYTPLPQFSHDSIYIGAGEEVTLSGEGEIRYTLDGSEPNRSSAIYSGPIPIRHNTVVRAAAYADDRICGGIVTHTYITDPPHDLAVVCFSTKPANLFDYYTGIYEKGPYASSELPYFGANFWGNTEVPIGFEFYENDGASAVSFDAGIKIFGQFSRGIPQKSMSVHLREAYGDSWVRYPFFEDNDVTEYHDLLLRSAGQDWGSAKLRDPLTHMIVKEPMDLDLMDYRPVALYINGEYWGLYSLRDKVNEQYLYTHRGVDPDNVDVIKSDSFAQSGDMQAYHELMDYLKTHNLADQNCYDYIASIVDVDEVLDYWIAEIYFANTDTGNIKIYKERTPDSKWRLIYYDLDWALFPTTYRWDMLWQAIDPEGHGTANIFPTELLRGLLQNPDCREEFIERFAYHLQTTFAPERTSEILHKMADTIRSEIPRQHARWGQPAPHIWEDNIEFLEKAMRVRVEKCKTDLQENFGLSQERMRELFPDS